MLSSDYLGTVYLDYRLIVPRLWKQRSWFCTKSTEVQQGLLGLEQCHAEARSQLGIGTSPELQNLPRTLSTADCRAISHLLSAETSLGQHQVRACKSSRAQEILHQEEFLHYSSPQVPRYPHNLLPVQSQPSLPWPQENKEVCIRRWKRGRYTHGQFCQVYYCILELKSCCQ